MNHFVSAISKILKRENSQIYLKSLNFILLSKSSGLIEFVENSHSVSSLKKIYQGLNLHEIFREKFKNNFEEA